MTSAESALPEFNDPPVNETALSIQFAPLEKFGLPHYGLYWTKIRSDFAKFQTHVPLLSTTEQFGEALPGQPQFGIQFITQPDVRIWFLNDSGSQIIQVQRDRFVHNWRQLTGKEKYPRYPAVKNTLQKEWARFREFLKSEDLGTPQVNQCEVTYVNHIDYKKGWNDYGDLNKVIAAWSGQKSGDFLPSPEKVNMDAHYLLPNKLGRLHISVLPVIRGRDLQEVLQITLTARGAPQSSQDEDVLGWIDLGREWVVKGFADFTNDAMHRIWGRKT